MNRLLLMSPFCLTLLVGACLDSRPGTLAGTEDALVDAMIDDTMADDMRADDDATADGSGDDTVSRDTTQGDGSEGSDATTIPPPGCPALPPTPTVLAQDDYWVMQPKGVAAREGVVYFGATLGDYQDPGYTPDGAVFRIQAGGGSGAHTQLESAHTYAGRPLMITDRYLAYFSADVQATGANGWAFTYPGVVVRSLETGVETFVGGPAPGWDSVRDIHLLSNANVAIVTSSSPYPDGPQGGLTFFDASTGSYTVTTTADFRWMTGFGNTVAAYAYADGGGITMVGDVSAPLAAIDEQTDFQCCRLMGADESRAFQRRGDTIEALPWDGSPPVVLATGVDVDWIYAQSGDMLYWAEHDEVWALNTSGNPGDHTPVRLATAATGYIEALTADRCGVYFSANSYPRLMMMAPPN